MEAKAKSDVQRSEPSFADACTYCTPRYWQQWWALMVKNWHVKRRNFITTFFEIAIPVLVMACIIAVRGAIERTPRDPTHYYGNFNNGSMIPTSDSVQNNVLSLNANFTNPYLSPLIDPDNIVDVIDMEQMATKIIRRGHIIAISPNRAPFFDSSDPQSFSSVLDQLINEQIAQINLLGIQEVRPSGGEYLRGFDSLSDMDSYAREDSYPEDGFLEAGIGFSSSADVRSGLTYTIRMNQTGGFTDGFRAQIPQTVFDEKRDDLSVEFNQEFVSRMYSSGFIALQDYIENWAILRASGSTSTTVNQTQVDFIPFPTPEHTEDDFADIMSDILPLLFALGFIWPVTRMIKAFVEEKELRIKEGMKIVGLYSSAHFTSWFTCYSIVTIVYSLLIVLISRSVFEFSAPGIVFFFFFLYGEVIIAFCWLVSTIFSKASVGSTLGALVFLGAFFGFFGIPQNTASNSTKLAACLSAPICFGFGAQTLIEFESVSIGVTAENFDTPTSEFSMADAYTMLIVDFILYMILALYFERVVPQQWGSHLPPWFVFLPSWWCPARKPVDAKRREFGEFYEVPGGNEEIGVAIENLYKRFDNQAEEEAAVKYVNLDMFTNQIFALLGHNGAGKTTLINMLTGMILPTKGDALIFGQSISTDMRDIRADLGMCPQHNILWDYLTVKEHLYVYGRLKGVESCEDAASELIQNIGLTEKTNVISKNLSGGMKRKLNVAMALIGGPRVVFLDEPTSGMDPFSRRSTWDMLKRAKERRVLILTTHFMDEADQLGDRIGIMHKGEIVACGTSLFLKNRYGVGYSLTITKKEGADSKRIKELVNKSIPKSEILSNVAGEISFQLPKASSRNFADLFDEIDKNLETLGVDAYSISVTTLEEVFLRVGEGVNRTKHIEAKVSSEEASLEKKQDHKVISIKTSNNNAIIDAKVIEVSKEEVPMGRMFTALIMKRWLSSKRNINIWLWQLVYPTLIIIAGIGLLRLGLDNFRRDISLSTDQYNSPLRVPVGSSSFAPLISVDSSNLPLLNVTTPEGDSLTQTENCQFNPSNLVDSIVDMSRYLLCTWTSFKETRYGAYVNLGSNIIGTLDAEGRTRLRTIFHNTTGTYASVIYLNILNTATYRSTVEDNSVSMDATLSAWPRTREQEQLSTTFIALIAAIGYAFMPASVARQIVQEREINSKHLQLLSGVPLSIYWATAFTWDVLNMLPSALLSVAWFSAYDIEDLTGEAGLALVVAVILYCLSVVAFTYVMSFSFSNEAVAQNVCLLFYILLGAVLLVLSIVLDIIPSTQDVNDDLKFIYRFFPSYCLGEVIINLLTRSSIIIWGTPREVWDIEITGYPMIYMFVEVFAYLGVVALIEFVISSPYLYSWIFEDGKYQPTNSESKIVEREDDDVLAEKNRIKAGTKLGSNYEKDAILLKGLRKQYGPKVAVKDMWFGVPKGQCFGFLGINGAGKTTTLKMVTGDVIPTAGTAELEGLNILTQQREVRKYIGYCPQFDALLPLMTARETLRMFAIFKGVVLSEVDAYVEKMIKILTLEDYADKPCQGYSGGNKRKLSVGIALVGGPPIVFLDEPSTGMDPVSRRFMWNLISSTLSGRSVVLTTHSMEECEALCARIGIMVSGRLQCLGSLPHLKQRYAQGFQLDVKVQKGRIKSYKEWIKKVFPDAKLLEDQEENMTHQVAHISKSSLGKIFRLLEDAKNEQGIVEYSVRETTLEQIFIRFAREQDEEQGPVKGFSQPRSDYMTEVKLTDIKNSSIAKNSSVELQRM